MKLKIWLVQNRMTIREFADSLGYSRCYIGMIINGRYKASKRLTMQISKATRGEVLAHEIS